MTHRGRHIVSDMSTPTEESSPTLDDSVDAGPLRAPHSVMSAADIGGQVRRLRILAGLSQHELACRSATSQPAIAHLEAGRRVPTVGTLEKLARALGHDLVLVLPSRMTALGLESAVGPEEEVTA